ncbi:hypothetical protein B566_EDAN004237 [Ephemera danica]|nr:hypothetical protein B566_EDAN004237 [Ephemera danica]
MVPSASESSTLCCLGRDPGAASDTTGVEGDALAEGVAPGAGEGGADGPCGYILGCSMALVSSICLDEELEPVCAGGGVLSVMNCPFEIPGLLGMGAVVYGYATALPLPAVAKGMPVGNNNCLLSGGDTRSPPLWASWAPRAEAVGTLRGEGAWMALGCGLQEEEGTLFSTPAPTTHKQHILKCETFHFKSLTESLPVQVAAVAERLGVVRRRSTLCRGPPVSVFRPAGASAAALRALGGPRVAPVRAPPGHEPVRGPGPCAAADAAAVRAPPPQPGTRVAGVRYSACSNCHPGCVAGTANTEAQRSTTSGLTQSQQDKARKSVLSREDPAVSLCISSNLPSRNKYLHT